jgi:hypothetical protein
LGTAHGGLVFHAKNFKVNPGDGGKPLKSFKQGSNLVRFHFVKMINMKNRV